MSKWYLDPCAKINRQALEQAKQRQCVLTKPAGSLGKLEDIAVKFAGWQGTPLPKLDNIMVRVFAGDHGVCGQGVSAFPQEVTGQMLLNFIHGGAAISVLSKQLNADFAAVNMGIAAEIPQAENLINFQLMPGTNDFTQQPAIPASILEQALQAGRAQVLDKQIDLFIGGEMGIGNTTSASAIYCALLELSPEQAVGPGTGVDAQGILRKQTTIQNALELHKDYLDSAYNVLHCFGGLEIAALAGSYIGCAQQGIPILVDGFISTAAALAATQLNAEVHNWLLFSHQSAEPAHRLALQAMQADALLNLDMRLGEGSGAAVAVSLLQSAIKLHNEMATFEQAQVSKKTSC